MKNPDYNLTKEDALLRLKKEKITKSEQMLFRWCRNKEIDAIKISTGHPSNRGYLISERSLDIFVMKKTGNFPVFEENEMLREQLEVLQAELEELKKQLAAAKETKEVEAFELSGDNQEGKFKYKNRWHSVLFEKDSNEIIQILRGEDNVTDKFNDTQKTVISSLRNESL